MKLVATDIDGTILPQGREISRRTIEALAGVEALGIPVVLVSARPPRWMAPIAEALGHHGEAICLNGAALIDLKSGRLIEQTTMPAATVLAVAEVLRTALPGVKLAVEAPEGMSVENTLNEHFRHFPPHAEGPFEKLEAVREGRAFKMLAHADGHGGADAMIAALGTSLDGLVEASHSAVDDALLEFSPFGVSKASALERWAAKRGVTATDVIAFGDGPNDVPMLEWAGTSYAVGGAHPLAKAAATHVAGAVEDDGVACVLEELLLGGRTSGTRVLDR